MGVANSRSIATAIAKELNHRGAEIGFSYLPDETGKSKKRAESALEGLNPSFLLPCNVTEDSDIDHFFKESQSIFGKIDFFVHSVAFASLEELRKPTLDVSRPGFMEAFNISTYSFIASANAASKIMNPQGSICAMTYYGGEKVIPGYNLMGLCKASLDHTIRYLAYDLGEKSIRCNGISAGPIRTLASSAVGDFKEMLRINAQNSPLKKNVTAEEVAKSTCYLLGPDSSAVTGEIIHVDCGYNIMGASSPA